MSYMNAMKRKTKAKVTKAKVMSDTEIDVRDVVTRSLHGRVDDPLSFWRGRSDVRWTAYPKVERFMDLICSLRSESAAERNRALLEMNSVSQAYKWVRVIRPTAEGYRAVFLPEMGSTSWEQQAIGALLSLDLSRLHRCGNDDCRAWLYGARRFCDNNNKCKQHAWDSKPENREKHNRKRREYYAYHFGSSNRKKKA